MSTQPNAGSPYSLLPTFPDGNLNGCLEIVKSSSSEFLAVSKNSGYIYKYSSTGPAWSKLRAKSPSFKRGASAVYDAPHNLLFIARRWKMSSINLGSGEHTTYRQGPVDIHSMVLIGDNIHIFGIQIFSERTLRISGIKPQQHCIFNTQSQKFVDDGDTNRVIHRGTCRFPRAIFQKSNNRILIVCIAKRVSCLVEYSLRTQKYRRFNWSATKEILCDTMVSSLNERYIVIFGRHCDKITVANLQENTVATITIEYPVDICNICSCRHAVMHKAVVLESNEQSELVMFGFVRQSIKPSQSMEFPKIPADVVQLMSKWYCSENIHLIAVDKCQDGRHLKIDMKTIIEMNANSLEIAD